MKEKIDYAVRMLVEMEYEKGIEVLEEVLAEEPKNEMALYNIGLAYNSINQPAKAIKTFEFLLKNHKKNGSILTALGYSYFLNHDIEKAKEILEEAVDLEPNNIYALRNLSGILAKLGDKDKAEKIFNDILLLNPKDSKALFGLGLLFFEKEDYAKSEGYFYQMMGLPISEEERETAKTYLTKIAEKSFKNSGVRVDAVMFLVSAINIYKQLNPEEIKRITFEIATIGDNGLDINNSNKKYKIPSLDNREMSGLSAICFMYVGFKIIDSTVDIGIDLSPEYTQALKLVDKGFN